jgi:hypothetical protein
MMRGSLLPPFLPPGSSEMLVLTEQTTDATSLKIVMSRHIFMDLYMLFIYHGSSTRMLCYISVVMPTI